MLEDGETLSQFFEGAARSAIDKRKHQAECVRRGIAAIQETRARGNGIPAEQVLARLETRLSAARQTLAQRGR